MGFALDLKRFASKTGDSLEETRRNFIIKLYGAIIDRTPVDTGRLKNNWLTSVATPNRKILKGFDKSGSKAKKRVEANLGEGDVAVYMSNNLPYAVAIEEGHSKENAPDGMVKINVERFESIMRESVSKFRDQV